MQNNKCVYLVGTGPGDPDLLTVKALRLIQSADVIVYDRLVSAEIINLIPHGVARIYVGKQTGNHTFNQDQINTLLGRLAQTNRSVVRLKGGDPMVFGRGSEEALYLSRHNVCFEVVPGITSASACTTYAGIPLTHRGLANQVHIITGHCREDTPLNYDWATLTNSDGTLVVYMGVAQIGQIAEQLIAHGLAAQTPAAAIEQGTTAQQRVCITQLADLAQAVERSQLKAPVMFVIGKVVSLANELDWFVPQEAIHVEASQA
jgi:uroporphyrin-III C-methyltransferase